jgi:glycosyltransferase involved in cell wall biosynthesis
VKFIFISDFFADEVLGGGEINNEELANLLRKRGHSVIEKKCSSVTAETIGEDWECCYIIGNFVRLLEEVKDALKQTRYIIYEHDHKYLRQRNPALFKDYVAPHTEIINRDFYGSALGVFCQSDFHCQIVQKNIHLDNIKSLGGNIWSEDTLKYIENLASQEKKECFSVMRSSIAHKNTIGSERYCESLGEQYELISSNNYHDFLKQLSKNDKFVFLPRTPETLSRVVVEARMLGAEVHTNARVGASSEEWFSLKGQPLIDKMRERREAIVDSVETIFTNVRCTRFTPKRESPKISLLVSLYDGDEHIEGFLKNMVLQSVFEDCELIIVDANSPGNEKQTIERYAKKYTNIIYKRLDYDPGIYGCWNVALEMATGEFISNANIDDRRSLQQIEIFANELVNNPDVDLVYSDCLATHQPNETYSRNSSDGEVYPIKDFSPENMIKCLPGCMPLWRKSMHDGIGTFNDKYKFAGDWDMWLKAVRNGSKFKRVLGQHGLYYYNPKGLSTDKSKEKEKYEEEKSIFHEYVEIFGKANCNKYREYFSR